jgi:hypothetical protein
MSADDPIRQDLQATRERQLRLRSEVRYLNERQREMKLEAKSTRDLIVDALAALDGGDVEFAKALLGHALATNGHSLEPLTDQSQA